MCVLGIPNLMAGYLFVCHFIRFADGGVFVFHFITFCSDGGVLWSDVRGLNRYVSDGGVL